MVALLLVGALAASACGRGSPPSPRASRPVGVAVGAEDQATLAGAGSTFAATMVDEWARLYRRSAPGVDIRYEAVGSGMGIRRLTSGGAEFAVTEVPMTAREQQAAGWQAVQVPLVGGAVGLAYNLPGIEGLRLSEETLARIYSGGVSRWDHPAVKRDNPGMNLPATAVTAVHRAEVSGTTLAFTRYLSTAGPEVWAPGEGASVDWPTGTEAEGSAGVLAAVTSTVGAIGYVVAGPARDARLQLAHVRNAAGAFRAPTSTALDAALLGATGFKENLTLTVPVRQQSSTAYPITAISHLVFPVGLPADKDTAARHFVSWVLSEGQRVTTRLGFVPLPLPLLVRTLEGLQNGGIQPRR